MLTSGKIAQAFEMDREPAAVRDRYGRHAFGQSLLLARRLVQAGVPVVQANMGRVQNWDTHGDNLPDAEEQLLPPLDQGVAALLDDLEATGLLDETLVMMLGEFGRTPKISGNRSRERRPRSLGAVLLRPVRRRRRARRPGHRQVGQDRRLPRDDALLARRRGATVTGAGRRSGLRSARPPESSDAAQPRRSDRRAVTTAATG